MVRAPPRTVTTRTSEWDRTPWSSAAGSPRVVHVQLLPSSCTVVTSLEVGWPSRSSGRSGPGVAVELHGDHLLGFCGRSGEYAVRSRSCRRTAQWVTSSVLGSAAVARSAVRSSCCRRGARWVTYLGVEWPGCPDGYSGPGVAVDLHGGSPLSALAGWVVVSPAVAVGSPRHAAVNEGSRRRISVAREGFLLPPPFDPRNGRDGRRSRTGLALDGRSSIRQSGCRSW